MSTQFSNGWAQVELGELIDKSTDKADPTEIDPVPYVGLEHIEQGTGKLSGHGQSSEVKSTKAKFSEGDLLYGKLRPYLNKVWIASFDGVCSTDILVFPPAEKVSQKYLYYRLLSSDFVQYANAKSSGVNHPRVSYKKVSQFEVGLPSLSEQRRIVAKIEELFSDLEAGVADLKRVKKQLQRYRQSVLQAAVEGRLTKAWREERDTESADKLLERILEERQKKWEKQYRWERYDSKDKEPPSGWKKRYKEPKAPAKAEDLPKVPNGWLWTSLDALTWNNVDYRGKTPPYAESGILTVSAGNVKEGQITFESRRKYVSEETYSEWLTRGEPEPGDLIITTEAPVGETALLPSDDTYLLTRRVLACQTLEVKNRFLQMCFSAGATRHHLDSNSRGTTVPRILKKVLFKTPLPLPPIEEQRRIVEAADRLLSIAEEATQTVECEIKRAERLRQSILKQAFSGQLVEKEKRSGKVGEMLPLFDEEGIQQVQNKEANNALKNLRGQWPGEESIDELLDALD